MAVLLRPKHWGQQKPPPGAMVQQGHPLGQMLVAAWTVGDGAGSVLRDALGQNNAAWNSGSLAAGRWRVGQFGACVDHYYDQSEWWRVTRNGRLDGVAAAWTLSVWVYAGNANGGTTGGVSFITQLYGGGAINYCLGLGQDQAAADQHLTAGYYTGSAWRVVVESGTLPGLSWQHCVGTFDGATLCLYRQGVLVGTATPATGPGSNSTDDYAIGRRHDVSGTFNFWNGLIDVPAIWARALAPSEVQWLYREPFAMFAPQAPVQRWFVSAPAAPSGLYPPWPQPIRMVY